MAGRRAHLLQVQATDRLLGRIVTRLRKVHAFDDTPLVVTADHGAAFAPAEPVRGVSAINYPQVLWTPMFVKQPGQASSSIDDRSVRSVDVVPTIADALGVRIPWSVDGRSVTAAPRTSTTVRTLDWDWSTIHPKHGRFLSVDGRGGFASVLKAQATSANGDPGLRLYRVGPYGALIGAGVAGVAGNVGTPASGRATVPKTLTAPVDPEARDAQWARPVGLSRRGTEHVAGDHGRRHRCRSHPRLRARRRSHDLPGRACDAAGWAGRAPHRCVEDSGPASAPRLAQLALAQ